MNNIGRAVALENIYFKPARASFIIHFSFFSLKS